MESNVVIIIYHVNTVTVWYEPTFLVTLKFWVAYTLYIRSIFYHEFFCMLSAWTTCLSLRKYLDYMFITQKVFRLHVYHSESIQTTCLSLRKYSVCSQRSRLFLSNTVEYVWYARAVYV